MIIHTPLPIGNHPIPSPICPIGVAYTLGLNDLETKLPKNGHSNPAGELAWILVVQLKECSLKEATYSVSSNF